MSVENMKNKRNIWPIVSILSLVCWMGTILYAFSSGNFGRTSSDLISLERDIKDLRAAMNIDSVRLSSIRKVMGIISQHNPNMPSNLQYEIASEIYEMSVKYRNLDVDLICAVITHETARTWRVDVVSDAGAMGLMQIMPATGMFIASYEGITWNDAEGVLFNPIYNIRLGVRYLSILIDLYGLEGGLAAYNGGEKLAALWIANGKADGILYAETSDYVPAVLKLYEEYKG